MPQGAGLGIAGAIMLVLVALGGYATIQRNPDWKNNNTLFLTDVRKSTNSALVNLNAGAACMMLAKEVGEGPKRKAWFDSAIHYFTRTIEINPTHYFAYVNRGLCKFNSGNQAAAVSDWDTVRKYTPQQVNVNRYLDIAAKYFFGMGNKMRSDNKLDSAIYAFHYGTIAAPNAGEMWFNLGNAYYAAGRIHDAVKPLEKAAQLMQGKPDIVHFYEQVKAMDK